MFSVVSILKWMVSYVSSSASVQRYVCVCQKKRIMFFLYSGINCLRLKKANWDSVNERLTWTKILIGIDRQYEPPLHPVGGTVQEEHALIREQKDVGGAKWCRLNFDAERKLQTPAHVQIKSLIDSRHKIFLSISNKSFW